MKKTKLVFYGVMSMILIGAGAANAAPGSTSQITSKAYVDAQDAAISDVVNTKADQATTYTKTEVDTSLATKANTADLGSLATKNTVGTIDIDDASVTKPKLATDVQATLDKADTALQSADLTDYAKTTDVDTALATKADTTYVDTGLATKADQATTYTKGEVDTALGTKADTTYVDTGLAAKADQATTYTKTEVDTALGDKADTTYVDTGLAAKANTADLGALATKNTVGTTDIDDASVTKPKLATDVQATLDKADTALQSADLAGYATTTDVTTSLNTKEDVANKSTSIAADTGSTTKYPTVSAVETYSVPKPSATCLGTQAQCVLSIDKTDGSIYWEDVAMPQ